MCIKKDIGQNIRNMRIERNMSQYGLAVAAGMKSGSRIGAIERGECSIGIINLKRIADGLEVKLADMVDQDPERLDEFDEDDAPFIHGPTFLTMIRQCRDAPDAILVYLKRAGIKVIP